MYSRSTLRVWELGIGNSSNIKADSAAETLPITPRFTTVPRSQRHEYWKIRVFRLADTVGGQGTTLCHFFWAGIEQKSIQVIS